MVKYVYPQLSLKRWQDFGLFRLGGPGLANCLFVAARAHLRAKRLKCEMLRPTWERFGIGQWRRQEKDKRLYLGLFKGESVWRSLRKAFLSRFSTCVATEEGLGRYFEDLIEGHDDVVKWFYESVEPDAIEEVPACMKKSVAVHVRLGDFSEGIRTPLHWYKKVLLQVQARLNREIDVQIFSDGADEDLRELLDVPGAHRVFYGNALADIVAISRCGILIAGSHSTFAAWGAFLGQVPSVFPSIDYGRIVPNPRRDVRLGMTSAIPESFWLEVKERMG